MVGCWVAEWLVAKVHGWVLGGWVVGGRVVGEWVVKCVNKRKRVTHHDKCLLR